MSAEIEAALREKLRSGSKIRQKASGEAWPVPMYPQPVLYADFDGYAIKPHPDTRRKVVTMLIYMPEDESQRELGTTVYKISPMGVFAWKTYGLVREKTRNSCPTPASPLSSSTQAQPPARELARPRDDIDQERQAAHDAAQHLVRQAAEFGRSGQRISVGGASCGLGPAAGAMRSAHSLRVATRAVFDPGTGKKQGG